MFDPGNRDFPSADNYARSESEIIAPEPPQPAMDSETKVIRPRKFVGRIPLSAIVVLVAVAGIGVGVYYAASASPGGQSATGNTSGRVVNPAQGAIGATAGANGVPGPMPGAPAGHKAAATGNVTSPAKTNTPKPLRPSDPVQVKTWNSGQAGKTLTRLTSQAGAVLMSHGAGEYAQMLKACESLSGTVKTAQTLPAIPDAAMQKVYGEALAAFTSGIGSCEAGITQHPEGVEDTVTHMNPSNIQQALKQFGIGMKDLYVSTGILRKQ